MFLKIDPDRGYRPFPGALEVNDVEVFAGTVPSEVFGYEYNGARDDLTTILDEGGTAGVCAVITEPATVIIWSLLGALGIACGCFASLNDKPSIVFLEEP